MDARKNASETIGGDVSADRTGLLFQLSTQQLGMRYSGAHQFTYI